MLLPLVEKLTGLENGAVHWNQTDASAGFGQPGVPVVGVTGFQPAQAPPQQPLGLPLKETPFAPESTGSP